MRSHTTTTTQLKKKNNKKKAFSVFLSLVFLFCLESIESLSLRQWLLLLLLRRRRLLDLCFMLIEL
jgi:hypothetical protein